MYLDQEDNRAHPLSVSGLKALYFKALSEQWLRRRVPVVRCIVRSLYPVSRRFSQGTWADTILPMNSNSTRTRC